MTRAGKDELGEQLMQTMIERGLDRTGRIEQAGGHPLVDLVDTVGAGDGFAAIFMLGMLRGWPVELQMARADVFARAICGIRGAVPATDFYTPFLRDWDIGSGALRA